MTSWQASGEVELAPAGTSAPNLYFLDMPTLYAESLEDFHAAAAGRESKNSLRQEPRGQ
jgi:hypothetical protein